MAIQVYFNGVDKSSSVLWETLEWGQALNNEADIVTFQVQKLGSRSFIPAELDEIILYDSGVKVFGGNIVKIDQDFNAVDIVIYTITAKDYTHLMDKLLVVETYQNLPAINIICDLLNRYINKNQRIEIATFQTSEIWSGGSADTINYLTGTQGLKLTSTGSNVTASRSVFLDLTQNSLNTSAYIDVDVFVDDYTKLQSLVLKFGDVALSNYFSYNATTQVVKNGRNPIHVLKSAFSSTGSPNWNSINKIQLEVDATGSNTVNVTFSNFQVISASAFTRTNAYVATQTVKYLKFSYEQPSKCIQQIADLFQWQWYVDENKDIHMFAIYGESAAFDLTDTNGNYVYRSLKISSNVDQLRNSIYVRGSDFLDSAITEDLRHQIDGNNKVFKLGYKYEINSPPASSSMIVTQAGNAIAVGTDNIDSYVDNQGVLQKQFGTTQLNIGDVSGNAKQSQQVIATKAGRRTKIKIRVRKVGTPADNFQIQIFSDNGSNQANSAISNIVTIAGASLSTSFAEQTLTLVENSTNSLLISTNAKFHIVASRSGANDASNYYQIDVYTKVYDGISNSGTSVPVWTVTAYNWYFVEVLGYEALYNPDTRILTFITAPGAGTTLTLNAQPYKPVFIQYKDNISIVTYGEYQFKIIDQSIKSKDGARQRALQEILAWSQQVSEGSFRTYSSGLRVGKTINVQSTIRNIDTDFLINRVTARARSSANFEYNIELVTTKTFGILYWLQRQILLDDKSVVIDDTEILDKLEFFEESLTLTDTNISTTLYIGHVFSNDAGTTPNKLVFQANSPSDATMIFI